MIARTWRGAVATLDADAYSSYLDETGVAKYAATPGNLGVHKLLRDRGDGRTEILMLTFWESIEAIRGFAGADLEVAKFDAEDDRCLVERDLVALHYDAS